MFVVAYIYLRDPAFGVAAPLAKRLEPSALNHPKQQRALVWTDFLLAENTLELRLAAPGPGYGPLHGLFLSLERCVNMRAIIEANDHVAAEAQLQLYGL